jgi:hypothetical protein
MRGETLESDGSPSASLPVIVHELRGRLKRCHTSPQIEGQSLSRAGTSIPSSSEASRMSSGKQSWTERMNKIHGKLTSRNTAPKEETPSSEGTQSLERASQCSLIPSTPEIPGESSKLTTDRPLPVLLPYPPASAAAALDSGTPVYMPGYYRPARRPVAGLGFVESSDSGKKHGLGSCDPTEPVPGLERRVDDSSNRESKVLPHFWRDEGRQADVLGRGNSDDGGSSAESG